MFYSPLLLSRKGALGFVWMAAHCYRSLKKDQVHNTDISASVEKILDGVTVVTHRILAFLLLGVVRIYSKKVEFLYHDCHAALNELSDFNGRKGKDIGIGVSLMHRQPIILPRRFELDAFDLDLLEDQDLTGGNVRSHELVMLPEERDTDTDAHVSKENMPFSETYSTSHTPTRDVFSPCRMDKGFPVNRSINMNISLTTQRTLWGNSFSLDDRMDPMILDEAEEEQMYNRHSKEDPNSNSIGATKEMECDSLMNPFTVRSHSIPILEMLDGARLCLEDQVDPLVLDEAENKSINHKPSDEIIGTNLLEPIHDMECSSVACPSSRGSLEVLDVSEHFPSFKMSTEAEKGQGCAEPSPKEPKFLEENVEHLSTRLSFEGDEPHCATVLVDKEQPEVANKINFLRVITPESINDQQRCSFPNSIAAPVSELPGIVRSDVTNIPTPAARECPKITKKRKILYDLPTILSNKVIKNWIEDPSDIKRHKTEVPHNLSKSWRACKHAHVSQRLFEPCISGMSMDLAYLQCEGSCISAFKSVELSSSEDAVKSSGTADRVCEGTPDTISLVTADRVCEQIPDAGSPITPMSPEQSPIAPGTPLMHFNSLRPHDIETIADSDFLEPTTSFDSMEKCPCSSEGPELEVLFQEEPDFCNEEFLEKDVYSARTRMTATYLSRKFLDKMRKEKKDILNMSHLLAGKTKKENARLFYEILVLKTRDCVDVAQEKAYGDILMSETCKLKLVSKC